MKNIELNIEGMKCEGCVNRIKNVLSTIKGIETCQLSLEDKKLVLTIKKEKTIEESCLQDCSQKSFDIVFFI